MAAVINAIEKYIIMYYNYYNSQSNVILLISEMILLKELLLKIKQTFFSKKFLSYSIIGTISTLNVAILSTILSLIIGGTGTIASALGYLSANIISYFMNSFFTFHKKFSFYGYLRFAVTYVPNYIIYQLVSIITLNTFEWPPFFAIVIAAIAGVPLTFIIMKVFTFNSKFKK